MSDDVGVVTDGIFPSDLDSVADYYSNKYPHILMLSHFIIPTALLEHYTQGLKEVKIT